MSAGRWQHLDRWPREAASRCDRSDRSDRSDDPAGQAEARLDYENENDKENEPAAGTVAPLVVRTAQGFYHVRQYHEAAEMLADALTEDPTLPGAHRLLGLSLGHLGHAQAAVAALRAAIEEDPHDARVRLSLLSAELQAGEPVEPRSEDTGELAGAACWQWGQRLLGEGRAADAARSFARAAGLFAAASSGETLPERLAACYVGQAISLLAAGDFLGAQQAYGRLPRGAPLPASADTFARQLYELAEAARELSPAEQREVVLPLTDLVLRARLVVRFCDGSGSPPGAAVLFWEDLP